MLVPDIIQFLSVGKVISTVTQLIPAVAIPIIISYFTTELKIERSREKERINIERDWYKEASATCQLILWELEHLPEDINITDRTEGTSLNELGQRDDIKYLDERFLELLDHSSNAPIGIDAEITSDLRNIVFRYTNPQPEGATKKMTIGELHENLKNDLENLQDTCRTESAKSEKKISTRMSQIIPFGNSRP